MSPSPGPSPGWRRFEEALAERGAEAMLVTHPPNVRYLTGFTGSSGFLLGSIIGTPVLVTDFRYEEQAGREVPESVRIHIHRDGWIAAVASIVEDSGATRIAFEADRLSVADFRRLRDAVEDREWVATQGFVAALRAVKRPDEVDRIRAAAAVAERALEALVETVDWRRETTERAVAARLEYELLLAGSEGAPFAAIVAAGARSSLPHARPSDAPLRPGDFLLLDFGATVGGYCSDLTRTFTIGPAAGWQRELHAAVLDAQRSALEVLAPGAAGVDVDRAAREALERGDLARHFGHSTGHGIGLEVHEEPRLSSRSEDTLEPGNVVTVEPGVYLPGRGGVRIEDDVLVTSSGHEVLTRYPRDLREL